MRRYFVSGFSAEKYPWYSVRPESSVFRALPVKIVVKESAVIVLVADGLRIDVLEDAIRSGAVPELAALRDQGGRHVLTTVFPSVTGVAYIPMLTGKHPADVGVPGLRWYDRSRRLPALIGHSRSYVGTQLRRLSDDISPDVRTTFDLVESDALGMAAMVTGGLLSSRMLDRGWWHAARVIAAHAVGSVALWEKIESGNGERLVERIRRERPRFVFAAFTAGDKAAHAYGAHSREARASLQRIDAIVGAIRRDAERDGRWKSTTLMVVSDHGHSAVNHHYDLADAMRESGIRVRAHPWTTPVPADVAVMVGGNSMAQLYLDLSSRRKEPGMSVHWISRIDWLYRHPAVDLVATWMAPSTIEIRKAGQVATIEVNPRGISYRTVSGNPLALEPFEQLGDAAIHERTLETNYPDAIAQLASLVPAERSGDVIVSAAPGWDLRRRYEPLDHVSSHGALHAAHMLVPLLANRRLAIQPRRTSDVFTCTSHALSVGRVSDSRAA
jgi:hypothetical protein